MMLASAASLRRSSRSLLYKAARAKSTQIEGSAAAETDTGPIGDDGRHEIWREGIYDHDNEPK